MKSNYYGRFIINLASLLQPLHELLCHDKMWKWTENCQAAFQKAKDVLTMSKVLTHFNPSLALQLACDVSPYGVGAILSCHAKRRRKNSRFCLQNAEQG